MLSIQNGFQKHMTEPLLLDYLPAIVQSGKTSLFSWVFSTPFAGIQSQPSQPQSAQVSPCQPTSAPVRGELRVSQDMLHIELLMWVFLRKLPKARHDRDAQWIQSFYERAFFVFTCVSERCYNTETGYSTGLLTKNKIRM